MDDYHDVGPTNGAADGAATGPVNGAMNTGPVQAAAATNGGGDIGIDDEIMVSLSSGEHLW